MDKKFSKLFTIIFACFLFLSAFGVIAQNTANSPASQSGPLRIVSISNNTTFLGTNVYVKGESSPNSIILLSINDEKDTFAYFTKTNSDAIGNWSADFNQSLKSGKYYIQALQEDKNGVMIGGQIKYGPIQINGSFIYVVGIFSFLVIVLLAGFVGGWYINKLAGFKRYRRILISQRDIAASYNLLKNDVDKALKNLAGDKPEDWKINETGFLLKRASDNLEKMKKYIAKGVNAIGKYDIINKIDDILKLKP